MSVLVDRRHGSRPQSGSPLSRRVAAFMLTNGLSAAHAGSVTAHYIRVTLAKSRGPMNKQDVGTNCFTDRPI